MEYAIKSVVNPWFENHPFIVWLLQHPIISVVSILLILVLFLRLLSAIAQLLDKLWIWLLKSPIVLIRSLFGLKSKSPEANLVKINSQESVITAENINRIIKQLELINQQQQQIIKEIDLLKKKSENSLLQEK